MFARRNTENHVVIICLSVHKFIVSHKAILFLFGLKKNTLFFFNLEFLRQRAFIIKIKIYCLEVVNLSVFVLKNGDKQKLLLSVQG